MPAAPVSPDPALVAAVAAALRGQGLGHDSLFAVRRKVDRLALVSGAADEKFDSLDLAAQARAVLGRRGIKADGYTEDQLAALVEVESQRQVTDAAPWQVSKPVEKKADADDDVVAKFLKKQGF
jgi:hypothetical protein